jgi:hypothetical protein
VGALLGAAARSAVAIGFLFYVHHWGGPWWQGTELAYGAVLLSAALGLVVGAVAGISCRPVLGAILGGLLSAGSCFLLFVVPAEVAISYSSSNEPHTREKVEVVFGLLAMTIAGAAAGGLGAAYGRRGRRID